MAMPQTEESLKSSQHNRNVKIVVGIGCGLIFVFVIVLILFVINFNIQFMPKIAQAFYTPTPTPTETPTPTATRTPAPTQDPNRYYASDGSFTMIIPDGWVLQHSGGKYDNLIDPRVEEKPIIGFATQEIDVSLSEYSSLVQAAVKKKYTDLTAISYDSLVTQNGNPYIRWVIGYPSSKEKSTYYFFENNGMKLQINYVRGDQMGAEYDVLVQEAINTLSFNP
ncbi:MAG: hypothetical protein C3F13_09115 [Anaerolineales bacterium]|nr:hypothetical protein [Anaerolineae bacterium]PWB53560.1 MAG: hypothetical protein C3F13_09115 [Anaerolineales bacterium]